MHTGTLLKLHDCRDFLNEFCHMSDDMRQTTENQMKHLQH